MRLDLQLETNTHVAVLDAHETDQSSADAESFVKRGIAAAQKGDREQARMLLTQAAAADPHSEDAWMWLASISEYPEELLPLLDKVLEINPSNTRAVEWRAATRSMLAKTLVQRGVDAHEEGAVTLAESFFDQAIVHDDASTAAWLWKARVASSDDDKVRFLERVLELDPENEEATNAIAPFREPSPEQLFEEAKWAAVAGKRKEALELLDVVLEKAPGNPEAWILASHLSLDLNDKLWALEKALDIDPENLTARAGYDFLKATVSGIQEPRDAPAAETIKVDDPAVEPAPVCEHDPEPETSAIEPFEQVAYDDHVASFDPAPVVVAEVDIDEPVVEEIEEPLVELASDQEIETEHRDREPVVEQAIEPFAEYAMEPAAVDFQAPFEPENEAYETVVEGAAVNEAPAEPTADFAAEEAIEPFAEYAIEPSAVEFQAPSEPEDEAYEPAESVAVDEFPAEPTAEFVAEEASVTAEPEYAADDEPVEAVPTALCSFCHAPVDPQAFGCDSCHAVLTLSDIESLLANHNADHAVIQQSVTAMEAEWNLREFGVAELVMLGIGHFNLRNFDQGFNYIKEASLLDPNNVILAAQVNTLSIRLNEVRRQEEIDDAKPKGKSILVIDDSPTVRKLISAKLEKCGHSVKTAADGVEGLERLSDGLPDLVLLDIAMPRMDGYEVCRQIRANAAASAVPVVMISGKDGFFDKVRGKMAGCTGYVTKPFGPETLMKALDAYLLPENGHAE